MSADPPKPAKAPDNQIAATMDVIKRYAKQETVEPLQQAGRFVAFAAAGAVALAVGMFLIGLGFLRFLQTEGPGVWNTSGLSIVALLFMLIVCALIAILAYLKIVHRPMRRD